MTPRAVLNRARKVLVEIQENGARNVLSKVASPTRLRIKELGATIYDHPVLFVQMLAQFLCDYQNVIVRHCNTFPT